VQNRVLYKKWETPNLKSSILQIIVPQKCIKWILEETHEDSIWRPLWNKQNLGKDSESTYTNHLHPCYKILQDVCCEKGPSDKGKSPVQIFNARAPFERLQTGPF